MNRGKVKKIFLVITFAFLISSCSPSNSAGPSQGASSPGIETTNPEEQSSDSPIASDLWQGSVGDSFYFTQGSTEGVITVETLGKGKCRYGSIGCDALEVGDRTVTLEIAVQNNGTEGIEVSDSMFEVEYPDGTRVNDGTGNAWQFAPDNKFETRTVRAGGKYLGTVTFEVPNGVFYLVMLTDSYAGEDLAIWAVK
jgi:hypothetical protein